MKQILQSLGTGVTELVDVPVPVASSTGLIVESRCSVVSAGTERMLVDFGRSNLIEKARRQPDKVRQVLAKVRTDGLSSTLEAVRSKLDAPIPLGYCQAGIVRDVGSHVRDLPPGTRVVTAGPHAEYVRVPWTLAARIPDDVPFEAAAFAPLAAIGLHGLRLAAPTIGETVVVYGLGLIGLLTVQLVKAAGCRVIGIDRAADRIARARRLGADVLDGSNASELPPAVRDLTSGVGADAVLLTLATESDEPVHAAADMSRQRGRLVLVGVAGLALRRDDFHRKELSLQVSNSYGPGRYDPDHEEDGLDYPLPYIRWTEGRNFAACLQFMADGRLDPLALITHRFPFEEASRAYDTITSDESALGIVLTYPEQAPDAAARGRVVTLDRPHDVRAGSGVIGLVGAGNFASRILAPAFAGAGASLQTVVSSTGTSAAVVARARGFRCAASDARVVFSDPAVDTVVVATRHDTHARLVLEALRAGKHVFVEKPLALDEEELEEIENALAGSDRLLCVGFNRRFAPLTERARRALAGRTGPLAIVMTINAGALPDDHWTKDPKVGGGRVLGEGCHFVDLARFLVGHPIRAVSVVTAASGESRRHEDVAALQTTFGDGSIASINYLANGPRQFPKERIELFWDGKAIRIENFRRLDGWGVKGIGAWSRARQDKGHTALVSAFLAAVRGHAAPPIPVAEILEVSRWAIRAGRQAAGRERA